jgi:erythromycin esterase-like protein
MPVLNTYAHRFYEEGIPLFYLDLAGVDYASEGAAWLTGPLKMRYIGASYCAQHDEAFLREVSLPVEFDGIVYFEGTNPTTSITF